MKHPHASVPARFRFATLVGLLLTAIPLGAGAPAPALLLPWSRIAAGGGTSAGGGYALSGTAGQHEAGPPMSGGAFAVAGGFWSFLTVVQTPGAPTLNIQLTPGNAVLISWPSPSAGFVLQVSSDLTPGSWATASESITDNGTIQFILIPSPAGHRSYRLMHP